MAMARQRIPVLQIPRVIRQGKDIHFVALRHSPYLVEGTDFVAFIRRIRNTVAEVKNFHNFLKIW
jgi:hypothetical protein